MRLTHLRFAWLAVLLIPATACGGDTTDAPDAGDESPAAASADDVDDVDDGADEDEEAPVEADTGLGECTVTLSGDLEDTIVYPQSQYTFTSDYWSTEEQLRDIVEFMGEDVAEGSYEEIVARGDPIIGLFLLNCVDPADPGSGVIIIPTNDTTADLMPMGPGTYGVSGGLFDAIGPAATVISNFGVTAEEQFDPVPGSGDLVVTRWDTDSLVGTLSFDGVESFADGEPREITVMVEFEVVCSSQFHSACR